MHLIIALSWSRYHITHSTRFELKAKEEILYVVFIWDRVVEVETGYYYDLADPRQTWIWKHYILDQPFLSKWALISSSHKGLLFIKCVGRLITGRHDDNGNDNITNTNKVKHVY